MISDGYLNNFHFPAPAVVERYVESGAVLLRTDLDGAVTVDATTGSDDRANFPRTQQSFDQNRCARALRI